ncbi:SLC13 family permease [Halalkalibacter alkaliphilus]|uniref:Sodium-dependent dicarboxylate transporter SdcS n=1 Tax=Halalkalibacter alkaliphilus TaxID=2917993 RepID=A0A9X2CVP9_9BACI|nr:DASS family sodium-coupled anion symporter [Halalkalibacter alkaliphilus]MCL7749231.1 anion permease [Halalkalibacter alkaliphilus]
MEDLSRVKKSEVFKHVIIAGAFLFLVASPLLTFSDSVDSNIFSAGAIFILGIILWITNVIPSSLTAVLLIVLFSVFDVLTFEEAASGLGNEIIWLVLAVLFMGIAVEKTGLDKRIAYSLLSLSKGSVKATLFNLIMSAFVLTFLIPNAVGRLAVLLPIGKGIIRSMEKEGGENIGKSIMLIVTYSPYVTAVALLTGASGSIYATGLFETMLGYSWNYLQWMIIMVPMIFVVLIALWLIVLFLFPSRASKISDSQEYFEQERKGMGPISTSERKLLCLYVLLIFLWITRDYHHLSISLSAVIVLVLMFLPGIKLLEWKESLKKVDWGVPILFAAGFAIANAFEKSGIVYLLSDVAVRFLQDFSIFILALSIMLIFVVIRLCFTNFNAMVATLMPVAISFAITTPYNPLWIGMISLIASSTAYLIPTQAIGSMMTFTLGYYNNKDMFKAGGLLTICIIFIALLFSFFYWPFVGLDMY